MDNSNGHAMTSITPEQYEKLGAFYLGREYDLAERNLLDPLVLYDSKDLTTHALCVGMTGSGKTGLCISLLEEAAIDGIPALVIDPKGDLANLLLTFPNMEPSDLLPWLEADAAARAGMTLEELAEHEAIKWREGLADWGMSTERIGLLRESADVSVYTPGSDAGLPLSVLASFSAPTAEMLDDADLMRDRISTTASSLLALLGISADPIRSREHILLSTILDNQWREGRDLELGDLIRLVQQPPVDRVGVLDLESFYPEKDRFELAMALNNLLAAPGFSSWLQGDPLDVDQLLYTPEGKPRLTILSIAHLSDAERMFFVSLLLNETIGWMRSRPGTTSLRAIVYMDEIQGYIPPVAEPASKKPLLTLLKQARAFGVGVVLATQNPVDLDYKGLSNIGTWFLGRLQTERDKARVLDGLEGGANSTGERFDRAGMERTLAALGKRVFLMHNVHDNEPVVFNSRWALSYLRGPLTRDQIRTLMADRKAEMSGEANQEGSEEDAANGDTSDAAEAGTAVSAQDPKIENGKRPVLPPEIEQVFVENERAADKDQTDNQSRTYLPYLLGTATVHFVDTRRGLEADERIALLFPLVDGVRTIDWTTAKVYPDGELTWSREADDSCQFAKLPSVAQSAKRYPVWRKSLAGHLYRKRRYELLKCPALKEISKPGESERDFRIRISDLAHAERDRQVARAREKMAPKLARLQERIDQARATVQREQDQANRSTIESVISIGTTILSTMMGRKTLSSSTVTRAGTSARSATRASKQRQDVKDAEQKLQKYQQEMQELDASFQADLEKIKQQFDPQHLELETLTLKPRKSDIDIKLLAVAWKQA